MSPQFEAASSSSRTFEALDDPPGDRAIVTDLVVRRRFRRRGLGAALLAEAERYARAAGAEDRCREEMCEQSDVRVSRVAMRASLRRSLIPGSFLVLLGVAACIPLPIKHTALVTPAVTGTLHLSDGAPVVGALVATSDNQRDTLCLQSRAGAVTDGSGRFTLPAAHVRRRILWFTMIENFGFMSYWLCAGSVDSSRPMPRSRTVIDGHVSGDDVACLAWTWRSEVRLTCNSRRRTRIVSGGTWAVGRTAGSYRLILAEDLRWGYEAHGFVQWIQRSPADDRIVVMTVAELPTGDGVVASRGAKLLERDGRWYVTVISVKPTKWNNERPLTFELGPPGQLRQVPAP